MTKAAKMPLLQEAVDRLHWHWICIQMQSPLFRGDSLSHVAFAPADSLACHHPDQLSGAEHLEAVESACVYVGALALIDKR